MSELSECLRDLVRIPSPNPPGDTRSIAAYVAQRLDAAGCTVIVVSPPQKEGAASVVASIGNDDGPSILFHAHIDTVPIGSNERWTVDPYHGETRYGRLFGKGSIDDKAVLAAMIVVIENLADKSLQGRLTVVAAAEEEVGGQLGTRWLAEAGHIPASDFIVVGEQTHNQVATANKGVLRATVRTMGSSVHATNPNRGINAIQAMAQVVLALGDYHRNLAERSHPLVGSPTCNVGIIHGGTAVNVVPDMCMVELDRRMVPGETPEMVQDELNNVLASLLLGDASWEIGDFLFSAPFESPGNDPYTQRFLTRVQSVMGADPGPVGYLPGSDAKHLVNVARHGIVVFGPGSYEVAHAANEYVELKELEETTRILNKFARAVLLQEQDT